MKCARPPLPQSCSQCASYNGLWRRNPRNGGLERCTCPRGIALTEGRKQKKRKRPEFDARMAAAHDK